MIDSLVTVEERFRAAQAPQRLGVRPRDYLLVTLHRPALVDGPLLTRALARLNEVARELPVIFPVHPLTRKMMAGLETEPGILLTDPFNYIDFLSLEAEAAAVLTDSGGVQEETTLLGVPCFTIRDATERLVTIRLGTNRLLGLDVDRILEVTSAFSNTAVRSIEPPPLWDGHAAERISDVLVRFLSGELDAVN